MATDAASRAIFPRKVLLDVSELREDQKVPPPKYRHAAPSAPWPWMDFNKDAAHVPQLPPDSGGPWSRYPQSHFGNWTPDQVDVFKDGLFDRPEEAPQPRQVRSDPVSAKEYWDELQEPLDSNLRVRAIFIESITFDVLQILGASYNIEPFFFASSANWIPSRYQEDPHHAKSDHITIVLPFIRTVNNRRESAGPTPLDEALDVQRSGPDKLTDTEHTIDTQAPLVLSDEKVLLQDLLAIHMVRSTTDNVIISYHHHSELQRTTARRLRSLVQRTGDSVYWSKIYGRSKDPTFVFLAILWYALYAWDEALEVLYAYLSERLEATDVTANLRYTRELHKLQAHLLYYQQLLRDFRKSVEFVRDTPNPVMDEDPDRESSMKLLNLESENLLSEIERLEKQRQIQSSRLKNVMELSFSTVNIEDHRSMRGLTKATMQDSAAMKQISYLTMIFLPANFVSSVFGMNVTEINPGTSETLASYVESTIILMLITAWVVIALHNTSSFHPGGRYVVRRITWPIFYGYALMRRMMTRVAAGRAVADADAAAQSAGRRAAH